MRRMGGLRKYMPVTWLTAVIGSLALAGIPPFAGFFSKDAILEAVHLSQTPGHGIAYVAVLSGVFITALYSFRLLFMTFHGRERFDPAHGPEAHPHDERGHDDTHDHAAEPDTGHAHAGPPHESPWVVTLPLLLLAIPSVYAGWAYVEPFLFGDLFKGVIAGSEHAPLAVMKEEFHGPAAFVLHGLTAAPFWLALAGIVVAWFLYLRRPDIPQAIADALRGLYRLLSNKYYLDDIYQAVFADGARRLGSALWKIGDVNVIDGFFVNGSARVIGWTSGILRRIQSGYVYHYAFMMIIGVFVLLTLWFGRA